MNMQCTQQAVHRSGEVLVQKSGKCKLFRHGSFLLNSRLVQLKCAVTQEPQSFDREGDNTHGEARSKRQC